MIGVARKWSWGQIEAQSPKIKAKGRAGCSSRGGGMQRAPCPLARRFGKVLEAPPSSSSSSWREDSWRPLRRLSMMTVILCLLPLPSDTQWWSIANLRDPRVTRTSSSSPPDSVEMVSGLDSDDLLQDLMRWSGGVQSGHVSEQHVTSFDNRLSDVRKLPQRAW